MKRRLAAPFTTACSAAATRSSQGQLAMDRSPAKLSTRARLRPTTTIASCGRYDPAAHRDVRLLALDILALALALMSKSLALAVALQ